MAFELRFECPLFGLEFSTDASPSPDVFDSAMTRFNRAIAETLAQVTPHATVILGDDGDDE